MGRTGILLRIFLPRRQALAVSPGVRPPDQLAEAGASHRAEVREVLPLALGYAGPTSVLALVGPAGGWEPHESERLRDAGFEAVGLGPRILRAETAAIAAVTALQVLWGDLS